jgi:hypothetical protein
VTPVRQCRDEAKELLPDAQAAGSEKPETYSTGLR